MLFTDKWQNMINLAFCSLRNISNVPVYLEQPSYIQITFLWYKYLEQGAEIRFIPIGIVMNLCVTSDQKFRAKFLNSADMI